MRHRPELILFLLALCAAAGAHAQSQDTQTSDAEQLKIAALEALIAAPGDRALPLVTKVLTGNHSDEVKERALFILSQIDLPEAHAQLLDLARNGSGELRIEAVRMIGIGGNSESLASLGGLYESGDPELRDAILEAYLIAGDSDAVFEIAMTAEGEDFEAAVEMLAVLGATDKLKLLRDRAGVSESLINAYAISGDVESLRELAADGGSPEQQSRAIEGLMIAGDNEGLLEIYRASNDIAVKRQVLEMLAVSGSDLVLDIIDEALGSDR